MIDKSSVLATIEEIYRSSGHPIGWRLLSQPWSTVETAEVVFLGLNPGGGDDEPDHGQLSVEDGSAYVKESWKNKEPGKERLQEQVKGLFALVGIAPENILAGNLVPFRSKDWKSLGGKREAVAFGLGVWKPIISHRPRRLIITMGADTYDALSSVFPIRDLEAAPAGWGTVQVRRAWIDDVRLVGLPHLSRFSIVGREQSSEALQWALEGCT